MLSKKKFAKSRWESFLQQGVQWFEKHQTQHHIADAMDQIEPQSGHPVGKSCCRTPCDEVGQGAEGAKGKTEEAGNDAPEKRRGVVPEEQDDDRQNTPDIQILEPPHTEAIEKPFQKNKAVYHPENLFPEKDGVKDDEQADDFQIGQKGHHNLSRKQQGGQYAHPC